MTRTDPQIRFFRHVQRPEQSGDCWLWTGAVNERGYGRFGAVDADGNHRGAYAHRFLFEAVNGPIPEGLTIDHRCFTPLCVNPTHLRLLPHPVNVSLSRKSLSLLCREGHRLDKRRSDGHRSCSICERAREQRRVRPTTKQGRLDARKYTRG